MFIPKAKGKIGMLMMVGCVSLSITCEKCEPLFLCVDIKPKASSLFHGTCTCKKCELLFISVRGRNAKASRLFHGCWSLCTVHHHLYALLPLYISTSTAPQLDTGSNWSHKNTWGGKCDFDLAATFVFCCKYTFPCHLYLLA